MANFLDKLLGTGPDRPCHAAVVIAGIGFLVFLAGAVAMTLGYRVGEPVGAAGAAVFAVFAAMAIGLSIDPST